MTLLDHASGILQALSHETFPLHYFVGQTLLYLDELDRADQLGVQLAQGIERMVRELLGGAVTVYQAALALRRGNVTDALATAQRAVGPSGATVVRPRAVRPWDGGGMPGSPGTDRRGRR